MAEEVRPILIDRHGRPVHVKRIPPKGSRGKFLTAHPESNSISPFERFADSNGNRNKFTSY